jgi:pimeloyl-ACP methyl ester carboxylesterase
MIAQPLRKHTIAFALGDQIRHMVVHDWGNPKSARVLVCVHGLSRNGRDFDVIANALSSEYRVLCPDIPGRGESDWLASVEQYALPSYVIAVKAMLHDLGVQRFDWIGTSMGGLIGMVFAAEPVSSMRRFVINDVGPYIERAALDRIAQYVGRAPLFADYPSLFAAAQESIAPFGPLSEEERHHIVRTSCQQRADGQWEFKADPKIGDAFRAGLAAPEIDLWPLWEAIMQPTLILRGSYSDLLSQETVEKMLRTHLHSQAVTIANTGHAPMLMDEPTIARIKKFLDS